MSNQFIPLTILSVNNENLSTSRVQYFDLEKVRGGFIANLNTALNEWGDTQQKPTGTNIANYYILLGDTQFVYMEDGDAGGLMTKYTVNEDLDAIAVLIANDVRA